SSDIPTPIRDGGLSSLTIGAHYKAHKGASQRGDLGAELRELGLDARECLLFLVENCLEELLAPGVDRFVLVGRVEEQSYELLGRVEATPEIVVLACLAAE